MSRRYIRDRRGRFAGQRGGSKRATAVGAVLGGTLLLGGPAYVPAAALAGGLAGRAISKRRRNRRR
jgi:hypothetical protein